MTGPGVSQGGRKNLAVTQGLPSLPYHHHVSHPYIILGMGFGDRPNLVQSSSLVLLIAIQIGTEIACRSFQTLIDGVVHTLVWLGHHDSPISRSIRPTPSHGFRKIPEPFRSPILHKMLYLDALLVSNGGDTPGQLLQLTKAGGHDRKIHRFTLRSGPDAFKPSRKTGRLHGRCRNPGWVLFFYLSCHVDGGQDSSEMKNWVRARQLLADCWLPLVLLLVVCTTSLFLRELLKELTIAPLLSLLSLFILAMFRPPGFVLLWIFPFVLLSYFMIVPFSQFVWTRILTLLLGGVITAYASYLRTRAVKLSASLERLFSRITHPIIVSDVTSKIVFFNQAACEALKIPESELHGFSWFNLIMDQGNKARDIERYVRLGVSEGLDDKEVFRLVGLDGKSWEAIVIKEGPNKGGRLITTLK